jgi:hypothetical protein
LFFSNLDILFYHINYFFFSICFFFWGGGDWKMKACELHDSIDLYYIEFTLSFIMDWSF